MLFAVNHAAFSQQASKTLQAPGHNKAHWYEPAGTGEASFIADAQVIEPVYVLDKGALAAHPVVIEISSDAPWCSLESGGELLRVPLDAEAPNRLFLDGKANGPRLSYRLQTPAELQGGWVRLMLTDDKTLTLRFPDADFVNLRFSRSLTAEPAAPPVKSPDTPTDSPPPAAETPKEVSPIIHDPAILRAQRATSWRDGQTQHLLLENDVSIAIGNYGFRANRAVVHVHTDDDAQPPVHYITMYLDHAEPLHAGAAVQAQAPELVVTAATTGEVRLITDLMATRSGPPTDWFVRQTSQPGPDRRASAKKHVRLPAGTDPIFTAPPETRRPPTDDLAGTAPGPPKPDQAPPDLGPEGPAPITPPPTTAQSTDAKPRGKGGSFSFYSDKVIYRPLDEEDGGGTAVLLLGRVRIVYQTSGHSPPVSLSADNAVIFLDGDRLDDTLARTAGPQDVLGVYLEDNVIATNGDYTIRAPRVFYDPARDKAVILDAVFYAWDPTRNVPIYLRAKQLRQESVSAWSAWRASLTTSEFAVPHFSIASRSLTITQQPAVTTKPRYRFVADDNTVRVGTLPVFYWPRLAGDTVDAESTPLQSISGEISKHDGPLVRTTWDLFALTGRAGPDNVELIGRLDYLGDHGPGLGIDLAYDLERMRGDLQAYSVLHDDGDDEISNRRRIDHSGDARGFALWRHRQYLRDDWQLSLELGSVSDETFLEEFFRSEAELSKPYEASIYLKKQQDQRAFTFLTSYDLNNFTAQTTTLQSPGYTVDKLPELTVHQIGESFWQNRLTYFNQTSLSRMRIRLGEDTPAERGFRPTHSAVLFGIPDTTPYDVAGNAAGIPNGTRLRFDSRHEIQAPMSVGPVDLVPYVVGRLTAYDHDFSDFRGEDDNNRLWTTLGIRLHTHVAQTYDDVQSPIFDLDRLRHILEPHADIFWSGSTINPEDIPVYDDHVEALHEGFGVRVGATNRFQTQRGGDGLQQSTDWIVLTTDLVLRSDDTDTDTDIARFFAYRPEMSPGGDHFYTQMQWLLSDTFATVGDVTYSLEDDRVAQWRIGATLDHTPNLTTFIDYADIDPLSSRLLTYGLTYKLTRKYDAGIRHRLDLGSNESRTLEITLERKLPRWRLVVIANIDDVEDEQTFGVVLIPEGVGNSTPRGFGNAP